MFRKDSEGTQTAMETDQGLFVGDHYKDCQDTVYACIASTSHEAVLKVVSGGMENIFVYHIFQRGNGQVGIWCDREDNSFWLTKPVSEIK